MKATATFTISFEGESSEDITEGLRQLGVGIESVVRHAYAPCLKNAEILSVNMSAWRKLDSDAPQAISVGP